MLKLLEHILFYSNSTSKLHLKYIQCVVFFKLIATKDCRYIYLITFNKEMQTVGYAMCKFIINLRSCLDQSPHIGTVEQSVCSSQFLVFSLKMQAKTATEK